MDFKFINPLIVDPEGVEGSPYPRDIDIRTESERRDTALKTEGMPISTFDGETNPYIDYESIDLLLSLQHPRSDGYDEMCFIIMGQAKELLFKATYFELFNAQLQLRMDNLALARTMLNRSQKIIQQIIGFWDILSTISPDGFNQFRDYLNVASGQQSFMYRHIEFILGNKVKKMCEVHKNVPHVYPAIKRNFDSPSLYDDVILLLSRSGYDIAPECLERDWSKMYESHASVENAWQKVYENPLPENDIYMLGEDLVEIADLMSQYRWRHFTTVERILGYKPGTGGSSGVDWLRKIADHRFFPELWSIRTRI